MEKKEYEPYIKQRERLLLVTQPLTADDIINSTFTVTDRKGKQYKVEPLQGDTAADYKKRFTQLDRAVKAILGRTGNNDPVEVTVKLINGSAVFDIDPTPEQEEETEYRTLCKLLRETEAVHGSGIWAELGMERPPIGKPKKAKPRGNGSTTKQPRPTHSPVSRTSRPTAAPKQGR